MENRTELSVLTKNESGVLLGLVNLSHLVFNPCVDFTQLNAWYNPDINRLSWEYTDTHIRVETGCWYLGIKRRGHNALMNGELGPHLVISWAQASQTPRDYHYPLDTRSNSHTHTVLWGMCLEHMGNGDMGHTSASTVIIPWGHTDTHTHTHMHVLHNTKTNV